MPIKQYGHRGGNMAKKFKFNDHLFGKVRFDALTTNIRPRLDSDTATTSYDIAEGHRKYQEHIARERKRLGLE